MIDLRKIIRFVGYLVNRYYDDNCLRTASALSYTSLLALVPLMAVSFSILAAFPVFEKLVGSLQDFIFSNFIPASGDAIQTHMQRFIQQAASLTGLGVIFLMITALMLMNTIDGALNSIWRVKKERGVLPRFLVYWAVLTLGPVLVASSIVLSSYLISIPLISGVGDAVGGVKTGLLGLMPFLSTTLALTLLYVLVPYTRVCARHGICGAAIAAVFFEVAKKGFAIYVTSFPTYSTIYGALSTIPVFLVWIYISWLVVLFGAEIAYCLANFNDEDQQENLNSGLSLVYACRIIGRLWQAQKKGEGLGCRKLERLESSIPRAALEFVTELLQRAKIIHLTVDNKLSLSRDISDIRVLDVYRALPQALPSLDGSWRQHDSWNQALYDVFATVDGSVESSLDVSLKKLFNAESGSGKIVNLTGIENK
ncbi:MAG: virulence factor BrkB family protein [Gammaproteobacteria bacterium]